MKNYQNMPEEAIFVEETQTMTANHVLQRTRRERRGCNRCVPCAGSLSFGRWAAHRRTDRTRSNQTL